MAEMNSAKVLQSGNTNTATLEQQGSGNYGYLQQSDQDTSQAAITQKGTTNSGSVYQLQGSNNEAQVTQLGDSNTSTVRIGDRTINTFGSSVSTYQEGTANTHDVNIHRYAYGASVTMPSIGDNNTLNASLESSVNASVNQTGNNNIADVSASSYRMGNNTTEVTER
jgi:hypothetical protein